MKKNYFIHVILAVILVLGFAACDDKQGGNIIEGENIDDNAALALINSAWRPYQTLSSTFTSLIDMINAQYGLEMTADDFLKMGKTILKTEHAFNQGAGFSKAQDRLPEFFNYEPVPPHNAVWDFTDEELDEFWNF